MSLPAASGGVSCKRCLIDEVRSARKFINYGVYYHFLLMLPTLTAPRGGLLDPTANKTETVPSHLKDRKGEENLMKL
jgi:hypothetical protein